MAMLRGGIPLGTIFGISVRLHWSWFIIFFLVTWSLAAYYFPDAHPDWSRATAVVTALATSLLFFASVLAHELAHSVVAMRAGIPIHSITLFVFGGVSQMTREPGQPEIEFRMALAGPLASLAIGGLCWGIWWLTRDVNEPVAAVAAWLGWINVVLAVFNLIPGFPLDGGRVLRSIIWWRNKNLRSATRTATTIGRGFGYLFIFGGIFLVFFGNWIQGLWIAFIGWFLENAAVGSYRQVALHDMLQGHTVSEVMTRECPRVSPKLSLEQLVHDYILNSGRRCFPVVENDRPLGLVTVHNVKAIPRGLWAVKTVTDAMTPFDQLKWVQAGDDLSTVLQLMTDEDVNQLPVLQDGNIVGMVARDNLLSFINTRAELGM
ncbi:MAG: protease [Chloroflexi bacterium]|nr:MAG: protease [Chloroflexota bacterium]RLC97074.1 MAG: protease [Chloroflexota bacterium]